MPPTITIGVFALGAVLTLIGIMGGAFKIFGTEISGTTGNVPRWIAGILGVLLIGVGIYGSQPDTIKVSQSQPTPEPDNKPSTPDTKKSPPVPYKPDDPTPTPTPTGSPTQPANPVHPEATVAPPISCQSGNGDALDSDQITGAKFLGYRAGLGYVSVDYKYDATAHPGAVYLRVTALSGRSPIAQGFSHLGAPSGNAHVNVSTLVKDQMKSTFAEVDLCTEGHAIRVYQFPLDAVWIP
jgi:hypothetical protein